MDEGELCDAIRNIRDNDEADKRSRRMPVGDADLEPLTTVALLGMLQQMEQGKSLTLAHVKKADMNVKKMKAEEERALVDEEESELNADEEDGSEGSEQITMTETNGPTSRVSGDGTREATIRQPTFFLIEACDAKGKRITTGGESWAIAIRGPSQPRARVTDHGDGTYLVIWKPYVSGKYEIAVSHVPARTRFDELGAPLSNALPGSPFICEATPTIPCPSKCIVRGDHLTSAISRETHYFEVLFKDRLGQVQN